MTQMTGFGRFVAAAALVCACGGGTPPPETGGEDPPPAGTGGGGGDVAPASNAKVQEGMEAIQSKDFESARAILTEAHEADPTDPQAAFYLGVALEGLEEFDAAQATYEKALALDAKLVEAYVNLSGILLDVKKDAVAALKVIDDGLKVQGKHPGLLMNRALAIEVTGGDGLLEAYKAAVDASPDNVEVRYAYAENLARAGKKDEALAELGKIKEATSDAVLLAATSRMFGKLRAFAECVATLDKAIGAKATADLHVRRGVCRHGNKDDKGAEEDYLKAIELDESFAPGHYYLGRHRCGGGKKKEGAAALKKAVELGGNQGVAEAAKKALGKCK